MLLITFVLFTPAFPTCLQTPVYSLPCFLSSSRLSASSCTKTSQTARPPGREATLRSLWRPSFLVNRPRRFSHARMCCPHSDFAWVTTWKVGYRGVMWNRGEKVRRQNEKKEAKEAWNENYVKEILEVNDMEEWRGRRRWWCGLSPSGH